MGSIMTFSYARSNLKVLFDQVTDDQIVAIITRRSTENSVKLEPFTGTGHDTSEL